MSDLTIATYHDLRDKTVFVSGGASGIGASLVEAFCRQGANTFFVDIDVAAGQALRDRLGADTGNAPCFSEVDVTDTPALQAE